MKEKSDIAIIGLAVMGENLALNMESKGFTVSVFNRSPERVINFVNGRGQDKNIRGADSLETLVTQLERPRKLMIMIRAGAPVDEMIEKLIPLLDPGDLIIDGGNSNYQDTERRTKYVEGHGLLYIGTGVSGGEEGALHGPSMMPGGSEAAWPLVKSIFQSIAGKAKDGSPCAEWIGSGGAGHFVKMVHNGIEYGMLEAYGEGFEILHASPYPLDLAQLARLWNRGSVVRSWLLELAERAFQKEPELASIKGYVEDSGEGRWIVLEALERDVPATIIVQSLLARFRSRQEDSFAAKVIAALRNEFGGHEVKLEEVP